MKGKDYFVLGLTFITGMFAGGYLYITSFAPDYTQDVVQQDSEVVFLLQGQKLGGCDQDGSVCPSFELRENRSYSYVPQYFDGIDQDAVVTGTLGKDRFNSLITYINALNLDELAQGDSGSCSNLYDTNYAYHLVYQGQSYNYDTCNTVFKNSILATKFYPLWTRLATTTPTAPLLEDGISGFLEKQLDKRFEYDE